MALSDSACSWVMSDISGKSSTACLAFLTSSVSLSHTHIPPPTRASPPTTPSIAGLSLSMVVRTVVALPSIFLKYPSDRSSDTESSATPLLILPSSPTTLPPAETKLPKPVNTAPIGTAIAPHDTMLRLTLSSRLPNHCATSCAILIKPSDWFNKSIITGSKCPPISIATSTILFLATSH